MGRRKSLYHYNFTFPFVLKACSALSYLGAGRDIYDLVVCTRWESDAFVVATLQGVFDRVLDRAVVLWNSMIATYAQNGHPSEELQLCHDMVPRDFKLTLATVITVISAVALPRGREIHRFGWRRGFDDEDKVKTAVVDMYAKSGWVKIARVLSQQLAERTIIYWNFMICGYAMHSYSNDALALFIKMRTQNQVPPDYTTLVGAFSV